MSRQKIRAEIADLEKQEKALLDAIAVSVAKLDQLNDNLNLDRENRDRLKDRKGDGLPYDQDRLRELNEQIRQNRERVAAVRERLKQRRGRISRVKARTGRLGRQLRSLARPKVIDLNLSFRPMTLQGEVVRVIGHYTAGPKDENTADAIRLCRLYHQAHLNQGWSGEAYMLCFTRDGDILLLRPARYVGAHTLGYNTGSYGVMCHGTTGDKPTRAQKWAMRWWAKNGHKTFMGKGQTQKPPAEYDWKVHRDYNPTACPGSFETAYRTKGTRG